MKLVVFDIDGVILDVETGGFKYLAEAIGKKKEMEKLHQEYQKRKHSGPWGLEQLAALFKGAPYDKLNQIASSFCRSHLMSGAKEAIDELKAKGYKIGLFSSNPIIIIKHLKEMFGAAYISGNELEFKDGICTGKLARKVDRYEKAEDLRKVLEAGSFSEVYIIGDSITDVPLARYGVFISFNSKDAEVDKIAKHIIKEKDLKKILKVIV